ncbi:MAG: condensation domain-containing protein [Pyrinomonadaceae bacterium]
MSTNDVAIRRAKLSGTKLALLEKRLSRKTVAREKTPVISRRPNHDQSALSFIQEQLLEAVSLEGRPSYYNIVVRFRGPLNTGALEQSLSEIVRRHETLRTTFAVVEGQLMQVIAPAHRLRLSRLDLSALPAQEIEARAEQLAVEQGQQPFDMGQYPLFRVSLLQLSETEHMLLFAIPHIICDMWSLDILTREMAILYDAFSHGRPSPLPELAIQYADYAHSQRQQLQHETGETLRAYWKQQLDGCASVLPLPTSQPRPLVQTFRGAYETLSMPGSLAVSLEELRQGEGVTMFMLLLAAFKILLYRYTGQEDIIVGSATAGRYQVETEGLIGCFINLLPMRTRLSGNPTFRELLRRVSETALEAYAHQEMPFSKLLEELQPERHPGHAPLVQVYFALRNAKTEAAKSGALDLTSYMIAAGRSAVDLTLSIQEAGHGLVATFEYNVDLFDRTMIARMLKNLQRLLEAIVADPEQRLREISSTIEMEQ